MICTSVIGAVVALVIFAIGGGFSNQITLLKEDFFGVIIELECFTSGTVDILTSGVVPAIILFFLLEEIIVLIILYFKTESKIKKIIASVFLGIILLLLGISGFVLRFGMDLADFLDETKILAILSAFEVMQKDIDITNIDTIVDGLVNVMKIAAVSGCVASIGFVILLLMSKLRWIVKKSAISLLITFIIIPILLWLVENIIPVSLTVITIVVVRLAIIIFGCISSGEVGEASVIVGWRPDGKITIKSSSDKVRISREE